MSRRTPPTAAGEETTATPRASMHMGVSTGAGAAGSGEKSLFELERARLVTEISLSLEHVLMNLNVLNRAMEGVTSVGKEFESVEMLWSQFEGVMGAGGGLGGGEGQQQGQQGQQGQGGQGGQEQ
ncbi:DASH complex subunit Dad1-domain-containing protein [Peziza echinospora]|nr:DASH complex subunit Dad1-domain-containing protein [Peziza echinospora]